MNSKCKEFVDYIISSAPQHNKQAVADAAAERFNLTKDGRALYRCDSFAVRFNYSKSDSALFSHTVLSLSKLEKYDRIPVFVVLVRRLATNLVLLANTTFLKKISHSSQKLRMTNIKGSFNGSDIIRSYGDLTNSPENFDALFAIHQGFDWEDNLIRLVENTSKIKPTKTAFQPNQHEKANIFDSIGLASEFVASKNFSALEKELNDRCEKCKNEIFIASHIENTNIRGRLIESLITADDSERRRIRENLRNLESALPAYDTKNGLGDFVKEFDNGVTHTDIKTKIVYLNSNPKGYNIDKFLRQMSDGKSVFLFFFIGVDEKGIFKTILCSVFHNKLIDSTITQFHWAGRSSRGVTQFRGIDIDEMLKDENFTNVIDKKKAKDFLENLLDNKK